MGSILTYHLHWNFDALPTKLISLSNMWSITSIKYFAVKHVQLPHPCNHTLQPSIPDHSSQQQLRLSHSVLVSVAPGHFVWSHQWNQICTAERQPLVGGRQGRGQQQWPEALSLSGFLFTWYPHNLLFLVEHFLELSIDSQTNCSSFYSEPHTIKLNSG